MAIFNNMSITNKGQVLYAKAQAGQELHFTKMMVGSGKIDSRNPATLTTLIEPKFDVGIQEITPNTELKTATISGTINNSGVAEATYICEIGLFAQDPDEGEILYAYGTAGQYGDYYAPASMGPFSWNYQINAAIGNSSNVTIELSNLTYDYGVFNTNTNFLKLTGGNQKEINKNIDTLIANLYKLSEGAVYPVNASGTNDYTGIITGLKEYKEPLALAVKIPNDSTGACTININGLGAKAILKANGNAVTNLKANSIYTMRYNGTNFILQGEGGSGNATAADILAGKTASTDAGDVIGNIPNKAGTNKALALNETWVIPKGYHDGNGRVTQNIPNNGAINANLNCGQSKSLPAGYTSGGTITANSLASQTPANATAAQILAGYTAWVNGNLINGNAQQKQSASGVWQIRSLASGASVSFTLPFTPSLLCALDNYSPKSYWMYSTENTNVIFSGRYSSSYTSPNCEMTISGNTITFKNDLKVVYSADINYSIQA